MLSALWREDLTFPGCETASEHYETWLVASSLFLLPHLPWVTVKADEKEMTWTVSPSNKGEKGHWSQAQMLFWCQQNLCQWGETCWMLGREGAGRKAGERAEHCLWFCASPPGAGTWRTWQQDWTRTRRATENHQICCPFSLPKVVLAPLRLHHECQLLKTIALLQHIDYSWALLQMMFFWC